MMSDPVPPPSETDATDAFREAARAFFPDVARIEPVAASGELARVATPA